MLTEDDKVKQDKLAPGVEDDYYSTDEESYG